MPAVLSSWLRRLASVTPPLAAELPPFVFGALALLALLWGDPEWSAFRAALPRYGRVNASWRQRDARIC